MMGESFVLGAQLACFVLDLNNNSECVVPGYLKDFHVDDNDNNNNGNCNNHNINI